MPPINKIVKLGLESRANELYNQNLSLSEISGILSKESQQSISKFTLHRFFGADAQLKSEVVVKKAELQLAVTEAEISTIEQRQQVITGLLGLAQNAQNEHARVMAYKEANNALDSLDKRLGKLAGPSGSQDAQTIINITQNNLTLKDKIQRYRDMGILNGSQ